MRVVLKTKDEVDLIHKACQIADGALAEFSNSLRPGVTTLQLDNVARKFIFRHNGIPELRYHLYPFGESAQTSLGAEGFLVDSSAPSERTFLADGDIIIVVCGVLFGGYFGESSYTFCVGHADADLEQLLSVAKQSLCQGIKHAVHSNHITDIGNAINECAERHDCRIPTKYLGHAIGKELVETPYVPITGSLRYKLILKTGMCFTVNATLTKTGYSSRVYNTRLRHLNIRPVTVQFGQTVAIARGKAEVLSSFADIERLEGHLY